LPPLIAQSKKGVSQLDVRIPFGVILAALIGMSPAQGQVSNSVSGDLNVVADVNLRGFSVRRGAVLEVPHQRPFQRGGTRRRYLNPAAACGLNLAETLRSNRACDFILERSRNRSAT